MQQIADWLQKLGLGQYAQCFAENGIDVSVLRYLTDQDLEKIGVLLGHRRKMLAAIAELSGAFLSKDEPVESQPQDTAERRQVTVMFSDLVGSTALSARMDPEDLREVISAYQNCVAQTVRRFSGFIAQYMGDGVLAYFGYPQAHEDDAERAVQAGLELVAAVRELKTHATLQTRVGIATGLVVAGDLLGSGSAQEQAVVGETPNLAARLQGVAEPNAVVIAACESYLAICLRFRTSESRSMIFCRRIASRTSSFSAIASAAVNNAGSSHQGRTDLRADSAALTYPHQGAKAAHGNSIDCIANLLASVFCWVDLDQSREQVPALLKFNISNAPARKPTTRMFDRLPRAGTHEKSSVLSRQAKRLVRTHAAIK